MPAASRPFALAPVGNMLHGFAKDTQGYALIFITIGPEGSRVELGWRESVRDADGYHVEWTPLTHTRHASRLDALVAADLRHSKMTLTRTAGAA